MKQSEMKTHLQQNLGNRSISALETDWLNFALQDTAALRNWRKMKVLDSTSVKTVANKLYYPVPNRTKTVLDAIYMSGSNSRPLKYITPEEYRDAFSSPTDSGGGPVKYYTYEGEYIKLYPTPATTGIPIELFLTQWPIPFDTNADDNNPLGSLLDLAVIARATVWGATAMRDFQTRNFFNNIFGKQCKRIAVSDGNFQDWTPQYASKQNLRNRTSGLSVPAI